MTFGCLRIHAPEPFWTPWLLRLLYIKLVCPLLSLKYQNIYRLSKTKRPNKLFGPRLRANFSNTSSIATCSPSPRAGSGSACGLQPSEKEPPLQREDKEKACKQKRGGGWRQKRITLNLSDHSARAASCKQINKNRPCSHREQETGVWTQWNDYHDARSHKSDKMKRSFDFNIMQLNQKKKKKKERKLSIYFTNAANTYGRELGPHVKWTNPDSNILSGVVLELCCKKSEFWALKFQIWKRKKKKEFWVLIPGQN